MAGSPKYKVYTAAGEYIASCKHPSDAAAIIALYGDGATIRLGHGTPLWTEGREDQPAGESYDNVAGVCIEREEALWQKTLARVKAVQKGGN